MHTLLKLRAEINLNQGFKAGGGSDGGESDGRNGGRGLGDQKPKRMNGNAKTGLCWRFNAEGCDAKNCKFLHECDSCGSKKHRSSACGSKK
jgi:hypothetical protein